MANNSISYTAAYIAIKFYGLTRIKAFRKPFKDSVIHFYERLVQTLPPPLKYYHYWLKFSWVRSFFMKVEELLLPGDLPHILARKKILQKLASEYIMKDYDQLIILGAGFDHLGFHFAQQNISCIEIDTEKVITAKTNFLERHYPSKRHPHLIPVSDNFSPFFNNQKEIDPYKKTLIIAEGFFDYVSPETASLILKEIRSTFSHRPVLISTYFSLGELSFFRRKVYEYSIELVGERLLLKTPFKKFVNILSTVDFHITQVIDSHEINNHLKKMTNISFSVFSGFYIFTAE